MNVAAADHASIELDHQQQQQTTAPTCTTTETVSESTAEVESSGISLEQADTGAAIDGDCFYDAVVSLSNASDLENVADDSAHTKVEEERSTWFQDVLIGQQYGHLAYLIDLLPLKLFSDISDIVDVSIMSEFSGAAIADVARGLCRRFAADNEQQARTLTKRTMHFFRGLKQKYLQELHKNFDLWEILVSRNVFNVDVDVDVFVSRVCVNAPGTIPTNYSSIGEHDHNDLDTEIAELRKKLAEKKLELEKNRKCNGYVTVCWAFVLSVDYCGLANTSKMIYIIYIVLTYENSIHTIYISQYNSYINALRSKHGGDKSISRAEAATFRMERTSGVHGGEGFYGND